MYACRPVLLAVVAAHLCALAGCAGRAPAPIGSEGEGEGEGENAVDPDADIAVQLEQAGFFSVEEIAAIEPETRAFELLFEQPVDHTNPDSATLLQRAVLVHKSLEAPLVLNPTGYLLFEGYEQQQEEVTFLLGANQLVIEHRFFGTSLPFDVDADDWRHLTVEQAAADHHELTVALRRIYDGRVLETGHSKGGMTSVFHAALYPDDVDAVVAYVAPVSFAINDRRGAAFLAELGDPACRDVIRDFQRNAASQREALLAMLRADNVGMADAVLESLLASSIGGLEWGFWQYAGDCETAALYVPSDDPQDTADVLGIFGAPLGANYTYAPYSYQVANQLGQPDQISAHLQDVLGDVEIGLFDTYPEPPFATPVAYDGGALMTDIQQRVRSSDRFLFVYGGYDPWTAQAFDVGDDVDSFRFTAAGLNHAALLIDLSAADKATAFAAIERWMGLQTADTNIRPEQVRRFRQRSQLDRAWLAGRNGIRPSTR